MKGGLFEMKTFLKYSGILAAVIAGVGFILMMTTPAFAYFPKNGDPEFLSSARVLFGEDTLVGHVDAVWSAIVAWILAMVGVIALVLGVIFPLLKLEKFAGLLNLIALCALVFGGVFIFISQPCTLTTTALGVTVVSTPYSSYGLNATWIIAAILYIGAGILAILPAAMDFIGGKKKKRK